MIFRETSMGLFQCPRLQTALFIPCGSGDAALTVRINKSRFVMRAWAFVGESQVSDDFLKIDDKTPDDRGRNHDKPVVD